MHTSIILVGQRTGLLEEPESVTITGTSCDFCFANMIIDSLHYQRASLCPDPKTVKTLCYQCAMKCRGKHRDAVREPADRQALLVSSPRPGQTTIHYIDNMIHHFSFYVLKGSLSTLVTGPLDEMNALFHVCRDGKEPDTIEFKSEPDH
jgi:hypothetical protein